MIDDIEHHIDDIEYHIEIELRGQGGDFQNPARHRRPPPLVARECEGDFFAETRLIFPRERPKNHG